MLGELDGSLSKLQFAAFKLIPYLPHDIRSVPVTKLDLGDLEDITHDNGNPANVDQDIKN